MGERGNQASAAGTETAGSHVGALAEPLAGQPSEGSHVGAYAQET